jgi:hypothetical protein
MWQQKPFIYEYVYILNLIISEDCHYDYSFKCYCGTLLCYELFIAISLVGFVQGNWREFQQSGDVGPWHLRQLQ